jgi:hypothetical protein
MAAGKAPKTDGPFEEMVSTVSEQAVELARQEVALATRELAGKARRAGNGAAMLGGAALLGVLASGTGTAGLVLLLARRTSASAAAFGVTGAYAGAGALLAREGLARMREAAPPVPEEAVRSAKAGVDAAKRKPSPNARSKRRSAQSSTARRRTTTAARKQPERARRGSSSS